MEIQLFDGFSVRIDGEPITRFATDKIRVLLAYLAIEQGRPHRRSQLATLLWPNYSDSIALRNLRQALYRLRNALSAEIFDQLIEVTRQSVTFNSQEAQVDVVNFLNLIDENRPADAMAQYRGQLLAGVHIDDADPFEEWLVVTREQLHQQALVALGAMVRQFEMQGDYASAAQAARRQVELEPWREEAYRQLMRTLAFDGHRVEALAQFEVCRRQLNEELGVAPSAETIALAAAIEAGELIQSQPQPDRHRTHHLPTYLTATIGRSAEVAEIAAMLEHERLVTLLGSGGSGKTRLAAAVGDHFGTQEEQFEAGIYFVALVGVADPEQLETTVATAIGMTLQGNAPVRTQLIDFLRERSILLILDNYEHLIAETALITALFREAPAVRIVATSRLPLNLRGERRFLVNGLAQQDDGVVLFIQAARLVNPQFEPDAEERLIIETIVSLVEGLPLPIELAAVWVRLMGCREIAAQIQTNLDFLATPTRDVPDRHRSIRAVFAYSWQLLSESERTTLAKLSVFRGEFSLEALLAVTSTSMTDAANLIDWSLLQRSTRQHYRLHELLRQFAAEKLSATPAVAEMTQRAHTDFYLGLVKRAADELLSPKLLEITARLQASIDNIRAGWHSGVARGAAELLADAASGLSRFLRIIGLYEEVNTLLREAVRGLPVSVERAWISAELAQVEHSRGHFDSALALIEPAVAFLAANGSVLQYANAQIYYGELLLELSRYDDGKAVLDEALRTFSRVNDPPGHANGLRALGQYHWHKAEYDDALRYYKRALIVDQESGNPIGIATSQRRIGLTHYKQSQYANAKTALEHALEFARSLGDRKLIASSLNNLGNVLVDQGIEEEALRCYEEAVAIDREIGDRFGIAKRQVNLGNLYRRVRRYEQAVAITHAALDTLTILDHQTGMGIATGNLGAIYLEQGEPKKALPYLQDALAIDERLKNVDGVARHLSNLGAALAATGEQVAAMAVYERCLVLYKTLNTPYFQCELLVRKAQLHQSLGEMDTAVSLATEGVALARRVGRTQTVQAGSEILAALLV